MPFPQLRRQKTENNEHINPLLQSVIDTLLDGAVIYTPDFTISTANKKMEKITGLAADELVGLRVHPKLISDERKRILTQIIFPTLSPTVTRIGEEEWPEVVDIETENPALLLRTVTNRLKDSGGNVRGFIKTVHDRTREHEILKTKREFLDTAAHQLRTPLNAMSWAFENIVKEEEKSGIIKEIAGEGLQTATRALGMVNNLLNAARIEEGKFGYNMKEVDVVGLITEVVKAAEPIAERGGIRLNFIPPPLPEVKIRGDADRLGMAFGNILDNALKYTAQNGGITVSILHEGSAPYVKVTVSDTGIGIPAEEAPLVFTKFFRAKNTTTMVPDGTGLGLYITKNIIKNHGGEIGIESEVGRGTTIWFTLPTDYELIPKQEIAYETE